MTIQEMHEKREALQIALRDLVKKFQDETGVSITDIRGITANDYIGKSVVVMVSVEVAL